MTGSPPVSSSFFKKKPDLQGKTGVEQRFCTPQKNKGGRGEVSGEREGVLTASGQFEKRQGWPPIYAISNVECRPC